MIVVVEALMHFCAASRTMVLGQDGISGRRRSFETIDPDEEDPLTSAVLDESTGTLQGIMYRSPVGGKIPVLIGRRRSQRLG